MNLNRFKAIFFIFFINSFFCVSLFAQSDVRITLHKKNVTLQEALQLIEKQTSYLVSFNESKLQKTQRIDVNIDAQPLDKALSMILSGTGLSYQLKDRYIMIVTQSNPIAQNRRVTGTVKNESGEPLIGVNVALKGAGVGAITNINGVFELQGGKGEVLEFSYIGYASQELTLGDAVAYVVVLREDAKVLDEVVVTALGIKRSDKALSYTVQKVSNESLTSIKDANFMNSLSGKVAGVNIQRSASGVGGGTRVVMRGNKSISGDNNVLYVVDGIPIGNQSDRSGDGTGFGQGRTSSEGIANFNPEDIESISVLTGPSAAALYGSSGANGVILINTKKGDVGKLRVNVSSSIEMESPFIMPEFQNTYGNVSGTYSSWGDKLASPSSYDPKDFLKTGATYNNSFNISTGTDRNQTYFSASAINSTGMVPNNKYHRYNVMLRNTAKFFNDKLTLDASVNYVREYYSNMLAYGTYFNPIVGAYLYPRGENFEQEKVFERFNPTLGYNEQYWSPGDFGLDVQSPYWIAYRNVRPEAKDRYMLYASLKYDITDYLNISGRLRLDNTYTEREDKRYASTIGTFAKPKGRYTYSNETYRQKYADVMVNFDKALAEKFHATVNVGASFEEYDTKGRGYGGQLLLIPNKFVYSNIDPATSVVSQSGGGSRRKNVSIFASAELSWNSALYLTLTGRTDKPSQLVNTQKEWIAYPSVGLSAIITELLSDDVRKRLKTTLGFFKLRGSFTEVGSPIPFTGLTPGTVTQSISGGVISPYEYYPLPKLKAERTRSYEVGFDSKWLNNTISLGLTLYQSNTYNQLLKASLSKGSGYNYMFVQAGNVRNRGIEITLGFDDKFGEFGYNTMLIATANRNKIIKLASDVKNPVTQEQIDLSDIQVGRFRLREGGEIGTIYADEWLKRNDQNYVEYNPGQALPTESTTPYKLGSVNPNWNLGWRHGLSYKGFNLNFLISARLGGVVISKTQAVLDRYGVSKASAEARDNNGITIGNFKVDPEAYYRAVSNLDAYYVYSATNVRLQEVSLSYQFSNKLFNGLFNNLSLSVFGTNLWMIYNRAPYDPELTASTGTFGQGYDYFMLPSRSTYGLSLKFGF
ncbi:SusC/RagA family TonB-linked outer membrane protein [Bacteroides sp.]|uniref:SusC/RagA family TonB-linked outer membrane protein n=1 Tax=Bacteroides sp. TaxID=29523 RepID=UPI002FCA2B47